MTYCHVETWCSNKMHILSLHNCELQHREFATVKFSAAYKCPMPSSRADCFRRHRAPGALSVCLLSAANASLPSAINFSYSYRSTALALWGVEKPQPRWRSWSCADLALIYVFLIYLTTLPEFQIPHCRMTS